MAEETTQTTLARGASEGTQAATQTAGAQSLGWRAGLKAELRDHPLVKQHGNVSDFAKAAIDLQERSSKAVFVPGENATPEELAAYHKAMDVPESDDGYAFDTSKLPKEWQVHPEFDSWYRKTAREAGLSKAAAQKLFYELNVRVSEEAKKAQEAAKAEDEKESAAVQEKRKKVEAELRSEYKGEYESNIKAAGQIARLLGGEELITELNENLLGDSPRLIRALVKASKLISPDSLVDDRQAGQQGKPPGRTDLPLQYPWMREFYGNPSE